jgi:hypothetical protein
MMELSKDYPNCMIKIPARLISPSYREHSPMAKST